ncbi:MAG: substrate-binding domain-containing protein [Anaerolineales bacterium]
MPRAGITIRDVAQQAGVSHMTVSRVINGDARVSEETRARVQQAIRELDYRPSAIARSLARGSTRTLACIVPNLTDYTFASIIEGAEAEARRQGYFLLSSSAPDEESFEKLIVSLVNARRVDGLLIFNAYADARHTRIPQGVPVVLVGARHRGQAFSSVALDEPRAAAQALGHLLALGHRDFLFISGIPAEDCTQGRTEGVRNALQAAMVAWDAQRLYIGDWSATSGYAAVNHALTQGTRFTAIFAYNDRMALGAVRALREHGLRVPEDVSVIGFDDMPLVAYCDPPLTTLRQDTAEIGRAAAALLMQALENPQNPHQHLQLPVELIVRASTAAPIKEVMLA